MFWLQNDQLLYVGQTVDRYSVLEDGTLQISDTVSDDDGEYKCTAVNVAGRNVSTASLRVRSKSLPSTFNFLVLSLSPFLSFTLPSQSK